MAGISRSDDHLDDPVPDRERLGWAEQTTAALVSLTVLQREVVLLTYCDGLSQLDISRRLGVSLAAVRSTAATALQHLADAELDRSMPRPGL